MLGRMHVSVLFILVLVRGVRDGLGFSPLFIGFVKILWEIFIFVGYNFY